MITFAAHLKNRRLHINRICAAFLLWVFAIALTPWSAFHHHEEEVYSCAENGRVCMHKAHIGHQSHNCLICSAHFEKDYVKSGSVYKTELKGKRVIKNYALISASYTALISLALRGPPLVTVA